MKRHIKASEVKPGMNIGWDERGYRYAIGVARVDVALHGNGMCPSPMVEIYNEHDYSTVFHPEFEVEVTVDLPSQPDEPTAFGARVVVDGRRFLRAPESRVDSQSWLEENEGKWRFWDDLLRMGPVMVIPDQGWTVPDVSDANHEVPERIEEWPEDDNHLRAYKWRDAYGDVWVYVDGAWRWGSHPYGDYETPVCGPWTRVDGERA